MMIRPHTVFSDVPNRSTWSLTYNLPRLEILKAGVYDADDVAQDKIRPSSPFGQLCHSTPLGVIGRDLLFTMGEREIRYLVDLSETAKLGAFAFFDHPPV
jgi:hypothetical protein